MTCTPCTGCKYHLVLAGESACDLMLTGVYNIKDKTTGQYRTTLPESRRSCKHREESTVEQREAEE